MATCYRLDANDQRPESVPAPGFCGREANAARCRFGERVILRTPPRPPLPGGRWPRPVSVAAPSIYGVGRGPGACGAGDPDRARQDGVRARCAARAAGQPGAAASNRLHRRPARDRGPDGGGHRRVDRPDRGAGGARRGIPRLRGLSWRAGGGPRGAQGRSLGRRGVAGGPGAARGHRGDGRPGGLAAAVLRIRGGAFAPGDGRGVPRPRRPRRARRGAPRAGDGELLRTVAELHGGPELQVMVLSALGRGCPAPC